MTFAYPNSDIETEGWLNEADELVPIYSSIDEVIHDDADFAKRIFVGPSGGEPLRVIAILADDLGIFDFWARMTRGPRAGEYAFQQVRDRILFDPLTTYFPYFRCDYGLCGPVRAGLLNGKYFSNHGVANDTPGYYKAFVTGGQSARLYPAGLGPTELTYINGPWEVDLARQYGPLPHTPIPGGATQVTYATGLTDPGDIEDQYTHFVGANVIRPGIVGLADERDDLQAFTGSLANTLEEFGITPILVGKYENGYGTAAPPTYLVPGDNTTRRVPPGWKHWRAVTGDEHSFAGDIQDHAKTRMCEYSGPNPGDGNYQVGVERYYQYDWEIASITWSAGKATVTCVDPIVGYQDVPWSGPFTADVEVGDVADIRDVEGITNYNGDDFIITDVVNANTFKFALTGPLSAGTVTALSKIHFRKWHSDILFARQAIDILRTIPDDEAFYLHFCPRAPHGNVGGDQETEREVRYFDSVRTDDEPYGNIQFQHWAGGPQGCYYIDTIVPLGGTSATVTLVPPAPGLVPGDEIYITDVTDVDAYNGHWTVDTVIDDSTFTYVIGSLVISPGSTHPWSSVGAMLQVRKWMSPALSPGDFPIIRGHRRLVWGERHENNATLDDAIGMLLDFCEDREWSNVMIVFLSDNGYMIGDQKAIEGSDVWSGVGAKGWVWENSCRVPLFIKNCPQLTPGISRVNCSIVDYYPTMLDMFAPFAPGLIVHHAHLKRDGYSIIRLARNPLDSRHDRATLVFGKLWSINNSTGLIDRNQMKYIATPTGDHQYLFDLSNTILPIPTDTGENAGFADWETIDRLGDDTVLDARYVAWLAQLRHGDWYNDLGRNTCRDPMPT